jgi:hypothetical protein
MSSDNYCYRKLSTRSEGRVPGMSRCEARNLQPGAAMSDLETVVADLINRENAAHKGSAERRMFECELTGRRYSYEEAGPIIEDLDPFGWGATCRPLPVAELPDRQPPTAEFPSAPKRVGRSPHAAR